MFHFSIRLVVWNVDSTRTNVWKLRNAPRIYSENIYKYNRMLLNSDTSQQRGVNFVWAFSTKKANCSDGTQAKFLAASHKTQKELHNHTFEFSVEENVKKNIQTRKKFFFTVWEGKYSCISETYRHDRRVVWGFTFYLTKLFNTYIWNFLWCWWFFSLPAVLCFSRFNVSFVYIRVRRTLNDIES
jgi:hypothetical protein